MNKKYQVFISSTFIDLAEQRRKVSDTILRMGHLPVGMEQFNAADDSQWEIIKSHIDNSDYYVLILAHRYGTEDKDGISYTEKEYDYAISQGVPCVTFIISRGAKWDNEYIDKGRSFSKLKAFKSKFQNRLVDSWSTTEELAGNVSLSLSSLMTAKERIGWVRSDKITTSPRVAEEISRLSKENSDLKALLLSKERVIDEVSIAQEILFSISVEDRFQDREYTGNLLELFSFIAPFLITETSTRSILFKVLQYAFGFTQSESMAKSPAENSEIVFFDPFLQRLAILGLATSTANPKASSINTNRMWNLTEKGRQLLVKIEHPISNDSEQQ
jgi:Domain of unknown function (DUF4062)